MIEPDSSQASSHAAELIPVVYEKLRRLANWKMANEASRTLSATALVHEVWLKLSDDDESRATRWQNERHFFSAAAEAMRLILIDRARARDSIKRGGGQHRDEGNLSDLPADAQADEVIVIGEAVEAFVHIDPECAELVKLKYFVGLSWEEIASLTGESTRNLRRRWAYARSWLHAYIRDNTM